MSVSSSRRLVPRIVALGAVLLIYAFAQLPSPPESPAQLARSFRFESAPLPVITPSHRAVRPVRRSVRHIDAWISSVGAAVALHDLDDDGLANDILYVDVRSDEVVVAPVPGTPARFAAFDLLRAPGCAPVAASAPMGVVPHDVNEDGLADAVVYFWGRSPLVYTQIEAPGETLGAGRAGRPPSFECRELVTPREEWYSNAATFADADGDGHADLIVGNYFREDSGLLDPKSTSPAMQMQDSMSRALNGGVNRLLLWTPRGYRDVKNVFPEFIARGWTLAIGAQDLDGDLLPEIYFGNDFGADRLLRNLSTPGHPKFTLVEGNRRFFDPKSKVLGHDSFKGMGIDFTELNGDGVPDFLVSNITEEYGLEESNLMFVSDAKPFAYRDRSEKLGLSRSGWSWDVRFGDFDNDGDMEVVQATGFIRGTWNRWPELHELAMANDTLLHKDRIWCVVPEGTDIAGNTRNPFFTRASDGRWYDVARELGIPSGMVSRGLATADVDGDGRLDFATGNQWEPSRFFRNLSGAKGNAVVLHVQLADETRLRRGTPAGLRASPAIGATVRLKLPNQTLLAQVDGGNGHSGKRAPELHFGIGNAQSASAEVTWRDRRGRVAKQTFNVTPGTWTVLLGTPASSPADSAASRAAARGETPPAQPPGRRRSTAEVER